MVQRSECLCNGQIIGIETIYTVINGKQINNPEKLAELREKSRNGELYCPCGCGANLILVAGDRHLREQHFRIKNATDNNNCTAVTEGALSVFSKIVLKCWIDDKLKASDVRSRVPINLISDSDRKYEYTLLSREKSLAVCYSKNRINLLNEKFDILQENGKDIRIIYVVDIDNMGTNGQYPENNMKMQKRQGYCLFLKINGFDYEKAELIATYYVKNIDDLWQEIQLSKGYLSEYAIDEYNNILFNDIKLEDIKVEKEILHINNINKEKIRRAENLKRFEEEKRKREAEKENNRIIREQNLTEAQKKIEKINKPERVTEKKEVTKEELWNYINNNIDQQQKPVKDVFGRRWIRCICCGEIKIESNFIEYGGQNRVNLGTCKKCFSENRPPQLKIVVEPPKLICPECGAELKKREGRYGSFYGCSSFPRCKYTRNID